MMHQRRQLLASIGSVGADTVLRETVILYGAANLEIGARTWVNWLTVIYAEGGVSVGSDVHIGAGCIITSVTHPLDAAARKISGTLEYAPVRIEDGAWLGAGAIVLPGVTVGRDAIVGAGAVVTKDVLPGEAYVGNPARPVVRRAA